MSSIWHAIGAATHWLYTHLASVGISAVVTAIGGAVMWFLGFRKAKLNNQKLALEIDHIKVDTRRIELEVQRLSEERESHAQQARIGELSERIRAFAAEEKIKQHAHSPSAALSEDYICHALNASKKDVVSALMILKGKELASRLQFESGYWAIR